MDEAYKNRYESFNNLDLAIRLYEKGELSLRQIAFNVGCSVTTIQNDFVRRLGKVGYSLLRTTRCLALQPIVNVDITTARTSLKDLRGNTNIDKSQKIFLLERILFEFEKADVPLTIEINRKQAVINLFLPNGEAIGIRVAEIDGNRKEHTIGFHRFKISPSVKTYPFVIFALFAKDHIVIYVFKSKDIHRLRSLSLQFTERTKYG